jgi:hypothetical protein
MSKKLFSHDEILNLSNNNYVKTVNEKWITYTDEFKTLFIIKHVKRKIPVRIFEDAGFDIAIIGNHRILSTSKRWRLSYRESSDLGLRYTRKFSTRRPLKRETRERKDIEFSFLLAILYSEKQWKPLKSRTLNCITI